MPLEGVQCFQTDSSMPRHRSSLRLPTLTWPSRPSSGSPSSRMRTRDQSASGTSTVRRLDAGYIKEARDVAARPGSTHVGPRLTERAARMP
jgi:hypothetical protein